MSDTVKAQNAIADLVHGYAELVRLKQGALCGALFCTDATYELREADTADRCAPSRRRWLLDGRQAIADYMGRASRSDIAVSPVIQDLHVEISGAVARSSCVMMSQTIPAGHGTFGKYEDSYRCDSGAWHFRSRIYTIFLANSEAGR